MTGASGFVGGRVARALLARGHEVLPYGRRPASSLARALPGYERWDLLAGPVVRPPVDAVVHCAALVADWGPEAAFRAMNVGGTHAVLESFPSARRFVHVSTSSVYSDGASHRAMREDAPTGDCRHSAYGRTKAEAERVVLGRREDAVVLRPHIVYGPGDTTLLPRVLALRRFGVLAIPGDGANLLSATHVDNLALAAVLGVERDDARGAFNVADAEPAPVGELLRTLLARAGAPTRIVHVPRGAAWGVASLLERAWPSGARRGPPLTRYAVRNVADEHTLDIGRARRVLGYRPRWSYRDGPLADETA